MDQKMCFGIICITCAVRTENVNIFHYFSQKYAKLLIPAIGNNCVSIKDTEVKFAYNRGFSATGDRMVWPPSLLLDRKWPHPPIRRITAPWSRVNGDIQAGTVDNRPEMCFGIVCITMRYERKEKLIFATILRKKYAKLRHWGFVYSYESQHCTFSITANNIDLLQLHN